MRKGERVELNEALSKQVYEQAGNIPSERLSAYYLMSYLPMISDCLASIADSLEILTSDKEKPHMLPKTLFCENCGITETSPSFGQQYCRYCGTKFKSRSWLYEEKEGDEE